jgi:hypothetical protein
MSTYGRKSKAKRVIKGNMNKTSRTTKAKTKRKTVAKPKEAKPSRLKKAWNYLSEGVKLASYLNGAFHLVRFFAGLP